MPPCRIREKMRGTEKGKRKGAEEEKQVCRREKQERGKMAVEFRQANGTNIREGYLQAD